MIKEDICVSISCITYNHAPYIRQCLDSFLMQKTNFAFEVLIHDDCSTDGTTEIIKEYEAKYPDIIKPLYEEENQYQQGKPLGSAVWNFPRARGKYIAMCEGDDYWIDPLKLQKQVDFLEAHPDYGLVYAKTKIYSQNNHKFENYTIGKEANSFDDLIKSNSIATLTVCFRNDLCKKYCKEVKINPLWKMGDYPMWLFISLNSKIKFVDEIIAVYRKLEQSASHHIDIKGKLAFLESSSDICAYFLTYANRWDLRKVYKEKYCGIIMGYYISYNLPVKFSTISKYWLWKPKFVVKYLLSQLKLTRRILYNC